MDRRTLFKSLLGAALLPLAGRAQARPTSRRLLIQSSPLAGFQYHEGQAVWSHLSPGQSLTLVRESDNAYDRRAVRIEWHGRKLGYLPRIENTAVSQMLDRGERLSARIASLREAKSPWERVGVEVWWEVGG